MCYCNCPEENFHGECGHPQNCLVEAEIAEREEAELNQKEEEDGEGV